MDEIEENIEDETNSDMKPEQFDLTNQLFAAVYNVADSFGSEASDVAQVILTSRKTLPACKAYFPKNFKAEELTEEAFKVAARDADSANSLLAVLPDTAKAYGIFREDETSWWLCVFWNSSGQIGSNAFFRAHRVET